MNPIEILDPTIMTRGSSEYMLIPGDINKHMIRGRKITKVVIYLEEEK